MKISRLGAYLLVGSLFTTTLLYSGNRSLKDYYLGAVENPSANYKKNNIANARSWITEEYLPLLEGSVLFVGIQNYNKGYCNLVQNPELFETVDIDENMRKFGSPYAHYTSDIRFFNPGRQYDHICLFGCLAMHDAPGRTDHYTVTSKQEVKDAILNVNNLVNQGGTLLIDMIMNDKSVYRKNLRHIDEAFWDELCNEIILNDYDVIFKGYSTDHDERILLWVRKK